MSGRLVTQLDKVLIQQLEVYTTIGAYDWEQTIKQKLLLSIEMRFNCQPAGQTDELTLALDYAKVSQCVTDFLCAHSFALIERVAEETAQLILTQFPVESVVVNVSKPTAVVNAKNIAVEIVRDRSAVKS